MIRILIKSHSDFDPNNQHPGYFGGWEKDVNGVKFPRFHSYDTESWIEYGSPEAAQSDLNSLIEKGYQAEIVD